MYKTSAHEKIYPSGVGIVAMLRFEWPKKNCWGEEQQQANKRHTLTNTNRMAVMDDPFPRPRIACGAANEVIPVLWGEPKHVLARWRFPSLLEYSNKPHFIQAQLAHQGSYCQQT